jgi:hypothetical protein
MHCQCQPKCHCGPARGRLEVSSLVGDFQCQTSSATGSLTRTRSGLWSSAQLELQVELGLGGIGAGPEGLRVPGRLRQRHRHCSVSRHCISCTSSYPIQISTTQAGTGTVTPGMTPSRTPSGLRVRVERPQAFKTPNLVRLLTSK